MLTEAHAILTFIADSVPHKPLLPPVKTLARARAHEWMNFLSSTVHIAFRPLFRTAVLAGTDGPLEQVRRAGIPILRSTLCEVDRRLAERRWALGDTYSVCDAYLLVFWIWSQREDVVEYAPEMPNGQAHSERIVRPACDEARPRARGPHCCRSQSCLRREGQAPPPSPCRLIQHAMRSMSEMRRARQY